MNNIKKLSNITFLLFSSLTAQNVMIIHDVSGNADSTVTASVEIENVDPFVAFQFDLPLADQLSYVPNSASLTNRAADHALSASVIGGDTLRVFAYSLTQSEFSGTSGDVVTFQLSLGTIPGEYGLNLTDPVIGNSSLVNILTGQTNGTLTLLAPDISISPTYLDYDRVPLLQTADRSFTIQNDGNTNLPVNRIYTTHSDFEVVGDTALTISAGASHTVVIRFHSNVKGTYDEQVFIVSDDPDEPIQTVSLHAIAYVVNELDINDTFGRSGYVSTMTIDIANMEPFVGFSFDLVIPDVMMYQVNTVTLTDRAVDHLVAANTIEEGKVRVVSYSPTNTPFVGSEGDVVTVDFLIDGQGGFYNLNFENPVIGDTALENILSDYYGGTLEIAAPDIYVGQSSINFGSVSVFDTATVNLTIGNSGSDTLVISDLIFYEPQFFGSQNLPLVLTPGQNTSLLLSFHSSVEGAYQSMLRIRSNDPDEDPMDIQLTASAFIPNIMRVDSSSILVNDTGWVSVSIENNEPFVGFQFDLIFPANFTYSGEVELTERSVDHEIAAIQSTPGTLRVFAYSMIQAEFSGSYGPVARVKLQADSNAGDFFVELDNVIIGNAQSENIMSSYEGGTINVIYLTVTIPLDAGWNLVSWDVDTPNDSVVILLSNIMDNVLVVLGFEEGGLTYDPDLPQFSNLQLVDHLHGYWIKMADVNTLNIMGTPVPDNTPIPMETGWNLVSYLPDNPDSVAHALESIIDKVIVVLGFDEGGLTYDPDWPQFSNLQILSPRFGYWVKITSGHTLIYPE